MIRSIQFRGMFAAIAMSAAFGASSPCSAQLVRILDETLEPIRAEHNVPAMAAAVVRIDQIVASGATGVTEVGKDQRVTIASRWHIGSCTKAMTATMIGQLVHNKDLTFETTVLEILPELEGRIDPACGKVTIKQLLTHTAGLPDYRSPNEAEQKLLESLTGVPMEQRRQFLELLLATPPRFEPGTMMDYSNAGYAIVAALAEARTGMTYERLMRTRVFAPLGMPASDLGWPRDEYHPLEPVGHWRKDGQPVPQTEADGYELGPVFGPGGDVHCTIGELARFAGHHIFGLKNRSAPWMAGSIVQTLHEPVLNDYSCGWVKREIAGRPVEWHNGSAGTFFAWMTLDVERGVGVVVTTNCGDSEAACQAATEQLLNQFAPVKVIQPKPTRELNPQPAKPPMGP